MKKKILIFLLVLLLAGFGIYSYGKYQQKIETQQADAQWNQEREQAVLTDEQGKTYRRNTYVKAILLMGVDRPGNMHEPRTHGQGGQSDGIFLAAYDTVRGSIDLLMIPRDTMTEITLTDLQGNNLGQSVQHLTLAYAYGDGTEESCEFMSEAVSNLLGGLEIDGYMAVSLSALPVINDAVGGVTVTIDDPLLVQRDPEFVMGETITLHGDQAEKYLRYRDIQTAQSALDRMGRHRQYIESFAQAFKEKSSQEEGLAVRLLDELQPYMLTNLTKDQYLQMAAAFIQNSQDLTDEDILVLPGEAVEGNIYDEYYPNEDEIQTMIRNLFYRVDE